MNFRKIIDKIIQNWPAKIISLILALILLQFHKSSLLGKRYFSVPLICENSSGKLVPAEALPRMVKVSLWGETNTISPIREDDVIAYVNINSFDKEGEYRVPIQIRLKGTALNIEPLEVETNPAELKLKLENSLVKRVNIKLDIKGSPAEGFEIYETAIEPTNVEIKGPLSVTGDFKDLYTEPVNVDGRKTNLSGILNIVNSNALVSFTGINNIQYTIRIRETINTKTYENLPLHFEEFNGEFEVSSELPKFAVTVQGPKQVLASWKPAKNLLRVNCSSIKEAGTYELEVKTLGQQTPEIIKIEPKTVKVTVKKKKIDSASGL